MWRLRIAARAAAAQSRASPSVHAQPRSVHTSRVALKEGAPPPSPGSEPAATDFLTGISKLINASRTSTTKVLWQMRAQEREEMTSHLELQQATRGTPITPIAAHAEAQAPLGAVQHAPAAAAALGFVAPKSPKPTNPFPAIQPLDSFWSVSLPFDTELGLYDDYVRFDGGVRFERILEDLDAFAGNVAHLHVKQGTQKLLDKHAKLAKDDPTLTPPVLPNISIVTASVDGITLNPQLRFPMDKFLAMQGCVTWVGSSSMEIWIEIRVIRDSAEWGRMSLAEKMQVAGREDDDLILSASFVMVSRDTRTQKAAFVPPLDVGALNDADRARFERGVASATRRKREAATSLQRIPPTVAEIELIHSYIMNEDNGLPATGSSPGSASLSSSSSAVLSSNLEIAPAPAFMPQGAVIIRPKTVVMSDTEMSSATMTQPQDRNTNGKIFGGYLMKNAYELARCNAYIFCGANSGPFVVAVDTITFLRPVEIGSIISFRSKVCFSAGHPDSMFQMRVETLVHDLVGGKVFPSNVFHFTFQAPKVPVRKVVPNTYREAVDYLDGKRRREKLAVTLKEMEQRRLAQRGGDAQQVKEATGRLADATTAAAKN